MSPHLSLPYEPLRTSQCWFPRSRFRRTQADFEDLSSMSALIPDRPTPEVVILLSRMHI